MDEDQRFVNSCREEILDRTWKALDADRPNYHAALRMRVESPDLTSREIAEKLSLARDTPVTPARVRKTLERAHAKFADLLIDEVAADLDSPSVDDLSAELGELDLLKYCRSALQRRAKKG